jgi:hypothetical protein
MSSRRGAKPVAGRDGADRDDGDDLADGDEPGDLPNVVTVLNAIQEQLKQLTVDGQAQQAAFALLEQRIDDVAGPSPERVGATARSAGDSSCIRCHVRPRAVDPVTGHVHEWCGRYCRDRRDEPVEEDDDDASETPTIVPARRVDPDAVRAPASVLGIPLRADNFRHPYGHGDSGDSFRFHHNILASYSASLSGADQMQFKDLLALFVRWERLVALVQESLRADQVQELSWLWDVFQDFDAHFKSHVDAFLIAAAQEGPGQRLLAYRAFQQESAGNSLYNTDRARELSLKKQTKLFEEHGRKLSGAKLDDDDTGIASKRHQRGSRGSGRGLGAAGGGVQQPTQSQASQPRQQQQQSPQQQQRSSSRDSRGRQGQGRGGRAAGGGAARGGRGGGPQGGAGGGGAPALPP